MRVKLNRSILNRHLGIWLPSWFHFNWNSYIWIWGLSQQYTFWHRYELCSAKAKIYRQHYIIPDSHFKFWPPSWIPMKMELVSYDNFKAVYIANISWKLHAGIRKLNIVFQNKIFDRLHRSILGIHLGFWRPSWYSFNWNLYIHILCLPRHTFPHDYQFCSAKIKKYKQHLSLQAAILNFGRHLGFRYR